MWTAEDCDKGWCDPTDIGKEKLAYERWALSELEARGLPGYLEGTVKPPSAWHVKPDNVAPLSPEALSEYNPLNLSEVRRRDAQIAAEQIEKWHPLALAGDIDASKELRNWQQRRATLLGLDAPKTTITYLHEDSDLSTISTAELKRLLATSLGAQVIEGELVADPTKAMLGNDDA